MPARVTSTTDPTEALAACGDHLHSRPVLHNVALTVLHERVKHPTGGRYWWTADDAGGVGFAWQSPVGIKVGLIPTSPATARALADAVSADAPDVPGVLGDAASAAAFAGRWTEVTGTGAVPVEGLRTYQLEVAPAVAAARDHLRPALRTEGDLLVAWAAAFDRETRTESGGGPRSAATVRTSLDEGELWVWDDNGPVASARITPPVAGAVRVGYVYTPPEHRGRGFAFDLVGALSAQALTQGAEVCLLNTQLENASSNRIYRRLGYESVGEILTYRFEPALTG